MLITLLSEACCPRPAEAQSPLPDVDIILVMEVGDTFGWVVLHNEVLVAPAPSFKPLGVSVEANTGGRRAISLSQPRFEVALIRGIAGFKITVQGKMPGTEAIGGLAAFEAAMIEKQAPPGDGEVGLSYGLSTVTARVLEMYVTRR